MLATIRISPRGGVMREGLMRTVGRLGYRMAWAVTPIVIGLLSGAGVCAQPGGHRPPLTHIPTPVLAPPHSSGPVVTAQGATWTLSSLAPQGVGEAALWEHAASLMGVIGTDYRGPQAIGSARFERASHNDVIPEWLNFWYPNKEPRDHRSVVYFKRTLTGV